MLLTALNEQLYLFLIYIFFPCRLRKRTQPQTHNCNEDTGHLAEHYICFRKSPDDAATEEECYGCDRKQ